MSPRLPSGFLLALFCWLLPSAAAAHDVYKNWTNLRGENCCNNNDCKAIAEKDEREDRGVLEVFVEGHWCPILRHHYLSRGNAPNYEHAHLCVRKAVTPGSPCSRLLCYQPRPLS